jgi:hypothetical protein
MRLSLKAGVHSLLVDDHSYSFILGSSLFSSLPFALARRLPCRIGLTNVMRQIYILFWRTQKHNKERR